MHQDKTQELAVIAAKSHRLTTLTNGKLRISVDVEPDYQTAAYALFSQPDTLVALARLNPVIYQEASS